MRRILSQRAMLTAIALLSLLLTFASSQTWFVVVFLSDAGIAVDAALSGNVIAPLSFALSVASLAAFGAVLLTRGPFRTVLFAIMGILATLSAWVSVSTITNPIASSSSQLTELSGISGVESLSALIERVDVMVWSVLTVVSAILLGVVSVICAFTSHNWHGRQAERFRTSRSTESQSQRSNAGSDGRIDDWDALTTGEDPSA